MATVKYVYKTSPFYKKVKKGDELLAINGNPIHDVLDYMFFSAEDSVTLKLRRKDEELEVTETVTEGDLRMEFDTYLMDDQRHCRNKCVFCFIDQMPPNMRDTLYYKDDDFRLSLLYGNYVTLTNVSEEDMDRIVSLRVTPLNISVHTTNPQLRVQMMANPKAAEIMNQMQRFADAELNMRAQIVLCKNINDGNELQRSMEDLKKFHPALSSVSIVPVGLTKHRDCLAKLESFTREDAAAVIKQVTEFGDKCLEELGTRLFYLADEFYLKAELPMPGYAHYEDFEQYENGVGMMTAFAQEFHDLVKPMRESKRPIHISMATGKITEQFMNTVMQSLSHRLPNMQYHVYGIRNDFFGEEVTVTGLVTGQDLIAQLKGKELGDYLLIPDVMLRDNKFLDDISVRQVEEQLRIRVKVTPVGADGTIETILNCVKKK